MPLGASSAEGAGRFGKIQKVLRCFSKKKRFTHKNSHGRCLPASGCFVFWRGTLFAGITHASDYMIAISNIDMNTEGWQKTRRSTGWDTDTGHPF